MAGFRRNHPHHSSVGEKSKPEFDSYSKLKGLGHVEMKGEKLTALYAGLCSHCRFMRTIHNDRGSSFLLCERSVTDKSFPKYPRLPVLQCAGFERIRETTTHEG
jgi:hypothetical protein